MVPCFLKRCLLLVFVLFPSGIHAQVSGCTDPLASNYNAAATQNDGSCLYPQTTVAASTVAQLADTIEETSGLLYWNGRFWTHNDDSDTTLYSIDTADGRILWRVQIAGSPNNDWEDLAQDDDYIYIGDFGNNGSGNRQNLAILRVPKPALLHGQNIITPDRILFRYADQTDFTPTGNNQTDFDCEAFIATADSLYLFTKQWLGGKTRLYALPKIPGSYVAAPQTEYDVDGLITGATYLPTKKLVALSGYKIAGLSFQPFIYLLYDYSGSNPLTGNKRKILVNPQFHQTEALASIDGKQFFLTNEKLSQIITIPSKLQKTDLTAYLSNWYGTLGLPGLSRSTDTVSFYPNPARDRFSTQISASRAGNLKAGLYNESGQLVAGWEYALTAGVNKIQVGPASMYAAGNYWVRLDWEDKTACGKICLQP